MIITNIKAQQKNTQRVSIYVDGTYSFSLDYIQLLDLKIHAGMEVNEDTLAQFIRSSEFGKAYARALDYAMTRPRSQREMQDYCRRKQLPQDDCDGILGILVKKGYVNDRTFARAWVESRALTKAFSERRLRLELRRKGVDESIINEVLAATSYNEDTALIKLVAKKMRVTRYAHDPDKLMQYLARQGFNFDDIKSAIDTYASQN